MTNGTYSQCTVHLLQITTSTTATVTRTFNCITVVCQFKMNTVNVYCTKHWINSLTTCTINAFYTYKNNNIYIYIYKQQIQHLFSKLTHIYTSSQATYETLQGRLHSTSTIISCLCSCYDKSTKMAQQKIIGKCGVECCTGVVKSRGIGIQIS